MPEQRSVAVIGSGIAGLTAAYLTRHAHDVTLFEKDNRLGGHADTHVVTTANGRRLALDTGFVVHNASTYPTLARLFAELGVETQDMSLTFGVSCRGCGLEYSGETVLGALLHSVPRPVRGQYVRMLLDIRRFQQHGRAFLRRDPDDAVTLREFIEEGRYSRYFCDHFLLPLSSAIWTCPAIQTRVIPANYVLSYFASHGMLGTHDSLHWKTVVGGSHRYVQKIREALGQRIVTGAHVTMLQRDRGGVTVTTADGDERRFDLAIVATHADQALAMLAEPTPDEKRLLGAFVYRANTAVLHTDQSLLPRSRRARSALNYSPDACATSEDTVQLTYNLNLVQRLVDEVDYCVTLNDDARIAPSSVIKRVTYEHPQYNVETLAAQRALPQLNGLGNTYFCGTYHGWGTHEDACLSGARAATAIGGSWT